MLNAGDGTKILHDTDLVEMTMTIVGITGGTMTAIMKVLVMIEIMAGVKHWIVFAKSIITCL